MQFEHVDPDNPEETVIRVAGLRGEVVLAHITDTHISEADGREPAAVAETARLEPMYARHVPDGLSTAHYPRFYGLTGGNPAFGVRVVGVGVCWRESDYLGGLQP